MTTPPGSCPSRFAAALLCALLVSPWAGLAQAPAAKPYVLFMGTDLSIQQGKKFYPVDDVDGSEFVIHLKGEKKFIRTRFAANNVKVDHELKLAPLSVTLDDLQGGPGYTPGADPRHKFNARSGAQGGAQAARDWSAARYAEAEASFRAASANPQGPQAAKQYEDIMLAEQRNMDQLGQQLGSDMMSIPNMANDLSLELAQGNYDLVDVSFKISSPEPLDDPYMVVLVEFQLRDAKPGEVATLIHAKALDPIGPEPKYIRVREGGMPIGFKYLRHEVHIYNRGKEVATNASSKRVELNRDEAREYLLIEHLAANKNASVPPSPVAGSLPQSVRAKVSREQLDRLCYAKVAKDGRVTGVFADESASLPLADPLIAEVFADALFKPALAHGKPTEGVVRVRLGDLTL